MREADYILDIGPVAGRNGGYLVAEGTIDEIMKNENSITGKYLSGEKEIEVPKEALEAKESLEVLEDQLKEAEKAQKDTKVDKK